MPIARLRLVSSVVPVLVAAVAATGCVKPGLSADEVERRVAARLASAETWGRATALLSKAPYLAGRCPSGIGHVLPVAVTAFGSESGETAEWRAAMRTRFGRKAAVVVAHADGPAAGRLARGDIVTKIGRETPDTAEDAVDALLDAGRSGRLTLQTAKGETIAIALEPGCALATVIEPGPATAQVFEVRKGLVRVDAGFAAKVDSVDAAAYLVAREIAYADPQLLRVLERANSLRLVAQGYAQVKLPPSMPITVLPGGSRPVDSGPAAAPGEGFGTLNGVRLADAAADLAATSLVRQAGLRPQRAVDTFARHAGDPGVTTPKLRLSKGRLQVTQKLAEADTRANLQADVQRMARDEALQRAAQAAAPATAPPSGSAPAASTAARAAGATPPSASPAEATPRDERRRDGPDVAAPQIPAVVSAAAVATVVAAAAPGAAPGGGSPGTNPLRDAIEGRAQKAGAKTVASLFAPAPVAGAIVIGRVAESVVLDSIALDDRYAQYARRSAAFLQVAQPPLTREQYRATVGGTGLLNLGVLAGATSQQIDADVPWALAGQLQAPEGVTRTLASATEGLLDDPGDLVVAIAGDDAWPFVDRVLCARSDPAFDACVKTYPTGRFDGRSGEEIAFDGSKATGGRRIDPVTFTVVAR